MAMDELQLQLDRDAGPCYATELDHAAEILQRVHPIGAVKAIGRLEVTAALEDLFPADDAEPVTEEWLRAVGGKSDSYGGWMFGNGRVGITANDGNVRWLLSCNLDDDETLWIPAPSTRRQARCLFAALGIALKESP